jgi:AraC family transcriptional regulator of adaptative response/methylated-DNA-[protein]-cysteine methyltransferase
MRTSITSSTPQEARALASAGDTALRFALGRCSLGWFLIANGERGLRAILLGDDPDALVSDLRRRAGTEPVVRADAELAPLSSQVARFLDSPVGGLDLAIDLRGTAFQREVWGALREIPAGSTATYADIARRIGAPVSPRAVARACAANPLAVAVPCHRVVRADGAPSGYRWGVERKRALLAREARP